MPRCLANTTLIIAAIVLLLAAVGCTAPQPVPTAALLEPTATAEPVVMGPALPSPASTEPTLTLLPEATLPAPGTQVPEEPTAAALPLELTLLHTSDTWGYVLPCG